VARHTFVELEMPAAGILGQGSDLVNPDFVAMAHSAGIFGARVDDPDDLKKAVTEAFQHDGPALIDVVANRTELSMPPTIKLDQAVGFNNKSHPFKLPHQLRRALCVWFAAC
jgi:pyruvate dehydrogenase (quinone)